MKEVFDVFLNPPSVVWPLVFMFVAFVIYREIRHDVRPIFQVIVRGVAVSAGVNATACAIAFAFGLSASLQAFNESFGGLDAITLKAMSWHQYAALWSKVLNPFIVAVVAYFVKSPLQNPSKNEPSKTA